MFLERLQAELRDADVTQETFQAIVQRLLGYQVLYRDPDNRTERELYDAFVGIDDIVDDFFDAMGLKLVHRPEQKFAVIYPPGARQPYAERDDERAPALRAHVSKEDTALLLVCRMLYEKSLRAGETDENDEALVQLEDVYTNYKLVVHESMPAQKSQREELFKQLKRWRLIDYQSLDGEDALLRIRPTIIALSLGEFVEAAQEITDAHDRGELDANTESGTGEAPDAANDGAPVPIEGENGDVD